MLRLTDTKRGYAPFGLVVLLGAVGCANGPYRASYNYSVDVTPSEVVYFESEAFYSEDNVGQVDFFDVVVSDGEGFPQPGVEVEVLGPGYGLFLVPDGAIRLVDYPSAPEDWQTARYEQCYDPVTGAFDNTEEWCAWYYDTLSGQYYQFGNEYADGDSGDYEGYKPDYHIGETDHFGQLRFYTFLDAAYSEGTATTGATGGAAGGSTMDLNIYITIRVDDATVVFTSGG